MSLGEGSSFSSAMRLASGTSSVIAGSGIKEKQDSVNIASEISPISNNKVDVGQALMKVVTPTPFPVALYRSSI